MGESTQEQLRLGFDARVRLEFRGTNISSDAGCWPTGSWMNAWDSVPGLPVI